MTTASPVTESPESFAQLFEESLTRKEMRVGEVITAEVVRVDYNIVVVNAGLKSESFIPVEEFKNDKGEIEVEPGEFVSVAIESLEDGYGETRLSRDKAKRLTAWHELEEAKESGVAPPVILAATHSKVLNHVPLAQLASHALENQRDR